MNFRKMSLFAVLALAVVSLGLVTHHFAVSPNPTKVLLTDGGLPMPPPMGPSSSAWQGSTLMADGGLPMPPPMGPSSSAWQGSTLMADGGLPMPPPPPSPWGAVAVVS
jgi:predicted DNA-binding transcriptional regulator AlpA